MEKIELNEILLEGNNYEIGYQHGARLGSDIRSFLNRDFADINALRKNPLNEELVSEYVEPYKIMIEVHLPSIYSELEGLAEGADITIDQAVLLQIRRELIGTKNFTLLGDCTSFGVKNAENSVLAQTIDLPGDMTSMGQVFKIKLTKPESPEILMYSFSGLLGYMGMNSCGLSVCINLVVSNDWCVGIPPYLLVRAFLECETLESCLELVKSLPIASSRSFIISDLQRQIIVELTPTEHKITEGDFLTHTNHFIHPDLIKKDGLNIFSRNSSNRRKQLFEKLLGNDLSFKNISETFKDHSLFPVGICAHNESNFTWTETVASIIMYPEKGEFFALKGKPCQEEYQLFKF